MSVEQKKKLIKQGLTANSFISSKFINTLTTEQFELACSFVIKKDFFYVDSHIFKHSHQDIDWQSYEIAKALHQKGESSSYQQFKQFIQEEKEITVSPNKTTVSDNLSSVTISYSYKESVKKREVGDFVQYFNHRVTQATSLLQNRSELQHLTSINRLLKKKEREIVSVIAIVVDKRQTKNNHIILTVEDKTGRIKVLISNKKAELFQLSKNIVLDEVLGVSGYNGDGIIFATELVWPDVPVTKTLKKHTEEVYAVFLSDIHVGSVDFLPDTFNRFLKWINGKLGNEVQRHIAKHVGYVFIAGDLVDGVGIYPGQDAELTTTDIYEQYKICADYLKQIPQHIPIIICPGNHDALRLTEPQPVLSKDYAAALYELPNVVMTTNPSYINIAATNNFEGFEVLLYHGYSFDHYVANVETIRLNGGYDRADLLMKFLLQKRHLAPTHTSTLYIPDSTHDPLFIHKVPDFFITGHIHKSSVSNYRNITLISGSCWQATTDFQRKVGHHPEPGRVPVVNLKTREVKVIKFE